MYWGKIIGALAGFVLGHGLLGAVLGAIVGHWADVRLLPRLRGAVNGGVAARAGRAERQRIFSTSVVTLAAKLAKVDGVVLREEVDAFKAEFIIPPGQRSGIAAIYDDAKRDARGFEIHAQRLAGTFADEPATLKEILESLHRIALADGSLKPEERAFLAKVAAIFGFAGHSFAERHADMSEGDPYSVLGVTREAPSAEIKAAWRRLTREHHPDTLMAKGVPADHIEFATRRMATINAAYDRIRSERGDI